MVTVVTPWTNQPLPMTSTVVPPPVPPRDGVRAWMQARLRRRPWPPPRSTRAATPMRPDERADRSHTCHRSWLPLARPPAGGRPTLCSASPARKGETRTLTATTAARRNERPIARVRSSTGGAHGTRTDRSRRQHEGRSGEAAPLVSLPVRPAAGATRRSRDPDRATRRLRRDLGRSPRRPRPGTPSRARDRAPRATAAAAAAVRPPGCARGGRTRSPCRPESGGPS